VGFGIGLVGLVAFDQHFMRQRSGANQTQSQTRLALMIATGIGLHNFSEGLAIGQSSARGEIAFAILLIVGFGLHNTTEGFGIIGPLIGSEIPSWSFIGLTGLIGGGPTFLGTIVGYYFVSTGMSVLFLSLAAGALVYIIGELFNLNRRPDSKLPAGWGLFIGFLLGYLTDLILTIAGA
ncbi:MAG TPA: ZIP family metal transporter, partial [Longilinea sp.]|nr:ZIP family metal transporter [Longilinea sp.]